MFAVHGFDVVPTTITNSFKNSAFTIPTNVNLPKPLTLCRCTVDSKSIGDDVFSVTPPNKCGVDYLGESTKGDLNVKLEQLEAFGKFLNSHYFTTLSNF